MQLQAQDSLFAGMCARQTVQHSMRRLHCKLAMQELEAAEAAAAGRGKGAKKEGAGARKPAGRPTQAPGEQRAGGGKPAQPGEAKRRDLTVRCPAQTLR